MNRVSRRLSVCLLNPRFEPSFFAHDFALPILPGDVRCWTLSGALPLLAALTGPDHEVVILDENTQAIDFTTLSRFDVIGVTGMMVQKDRMLEILSAVAPLPGIVAVGGPFVTVSPDLFSGLADVRFIGEAEQTWPEFLSAVAHGEPYQGRYEQLEKTDMTTVPPPRFDLIDARHYYSAPVQFSRGCPFQCEFCDIITIFGRRPRLKTPAQLLRELDAVREAGFTTCFLVDDNFIGNRIAARTLLYEIIRWQKLHGYPLQLYTEASVDLAELPDFIDLMVEANILQVFIGIESPRRSSLEETRKHQNTRGDTLLARLSRIRDGGLVITAGFIVGFDSDDKDIFGEQYDFIQEAGLAQAIVAILSPIPTTPLYNRLAADGRLRPSDPEVQFEPQQMSREELRTGHRELLQRLYTPEAYFQRLFHGYRHSSAFRARRAKLARTINRPLLPFGKRVLSRLRSLATVVRLLLALGRRRHLASLAPAYFSAYWHQNRPLGAAAIPTASFLTLCALHFHYFLMSRHHRNTAFGIVGQATGAEPGRGLTQITKPG